MNVEFHADWDRNPGNLVLNEHTDINGARVCCGKPRFQTAVTRYGLNSALHSSSSTPVITTGGWGQPEIFESTRIGYFELRPPT